MSTAQAANLIANASHLTAFTGAGISVESGIPPFRGVEGLWSQYDPQSLEIGYFLSHSEAAWQVIREIFYDHFGKAQPNDAHRALATLETHGRLKAIITQNIDNLHQRAGSKKVVEFHGNSQRLVCVSCGAGKAASECDLNVLPPLCSCRGVFKPDFVFFGEQIPEAASIRAFEEARRSDVMLLIGTTGEVMPANMIPHDAKRQGAAIIEVNTEPSHYTNRITDIYLQGKATEVMNALLREAGIS